MFIISEENKVFLKKILRFALPVMGQELIINSSQIITSMMVGFLGVHAITGVTIGNQVYFLFYMFCYGINSSCAVFFGQFFGKKDMESIHKTMGISFSATFFCAFIFAIAAVAFPKYILLFLSDGTPQVVELGIKYLRTVFLSYFIIAVCDSIKFALRSTGQMKIPVIGSVVALSSNTVLCLLFIKVLNFGVSGAAAALVLSRLFEMITQITLIRKFKLSILTNFKNYFKASREFINEYLKIGCPVILNEIFWSIGTVMYMYCYKFTGLNGQGAIAISQTINNLFSVLGFAVGTGCGIMLAISLGAGEIELAKKYAKKSLVFVAVLSLIIGGLLILASPLIINVYDVTPEVKDFAHKIMLVIGSVMVIRMLNYTMIVGILRSGGDTTFCLIFEMIGVWCVGLPCGYIAANYFHLPVYFVLMAIYMEEVFKFIAFSLRTKTNKWARNLV